MKILVAENGTHYQVIGACDSVAEAGEMARSYLRYGPIHDLLAPERFVVISQDEGGHYMRREVLDDGFVLDAEIGEDVEAEGGGDPSARTIGCGCQRCKQPHSVCVGFKHQTGPCDCLREAL